MTITLPSRLTELCAVVGQAPHTLASFLPGDDPAAIDRLLDEAITGELNDAPLPVAHTGHTTGAYELRMLVRRAHGQLRRLNHDLDERRDRRDALAALLRVGKATKR